jgi:uncharacterized damage-inducible protein DinB
VVEQLVESWYVNHRVTLKVIDGLPAEAMKATLSERGGRDIARQLAHLHEVRVAWMRRPDMPNGMPHFEKGESPPKAKLRKYLDESAAGIERLLRRGCANGGEIGGFKRGVVVLLGYLIAHEAHHRGSILLTAKKSGFPLSEDLRWGLWSWDKI